MALDPKEEAATIPIDFAINFVEINISQMEKPCGVFKFNNLNVKNVIQFLINCIICLRNQTNQFAIPQKRFLTSRQNYSLFKRLVAETKV